MNNYKPLVQAAFKALFEQAAYDEKAIHQYFSKDYVQQVDGKTIHFQDFIKHIKAVRAATHNMRIEFKTIVQEGNIVFTNHLVSAVASDGRDAQGQVIAEFHMRDGQICYCSELTHMLVGEERNRDLGSRQ